MKYVMIKCSKGILDVRVPVIFPDLMMHADVARYMEALLRRENNFDSAKPVSAGFYDPMDGAVSGKSESLDLKSDPQDEQTIFTYQYTHGQV